MISIPKPTKIKSNKIRKSAKGEACTLRLTGICNGNRDTVVFAHLHTRFSGIATKSNDLHGFYACSECHRAYDNHEVENIDVLGAVVETQVKLHEKELIEVK